MPAPLALAEKKRGLGLGNLDRNANGRNSYESKNLITISRLAQHQTSTSQLETPTTTSQLAPTPNLNITTL